MIEGIASRIGGELDAETKEKVANEQLRMVWAHAAVGTLIATAFAVVMALHLRGSVELGLVRSSGAAESLAAAPGVRRPTGCSRSMARCGGSRDSG